MSEQVEDMGGLYLAEGAESVLPEGYKLTEVGVIPCDWQLSYVGELFTMQLGKMLDENKNAGSIKLMLGNRGVQWGRIDSSSLGYVRLAQSELRRYRLAVGDILVCEGGEVGRSAIWKGEVEECYFQKALHRLRPKADYEGSLLVNYLHWLARKDGLKNFVTQTSIAHLPKEKLEIVPIPVPTNKQEQTAIATALSDVDALISEQEKLIAKKQAIKTATMQQLLTGRTRLPQFALREDGSVKGYKQSELGEVPEDWEVVSLRSCLAESPKYGINAAAVPLSGNYPAYIRITDISEAGYFEPSKRVGVSHPLSGLYFLREGDIVLARTGASVGKSYLYRPEDGKLVYAGFLINVSPDQAKLNSAYLSQYLKTKRYWDWVEVNSMRSGQPGVNGNEFGGMVLPMPELEEQIQISGILSDMDDAVRQLEVNLKKIRKIKQGMMQELLTGKTRLLNSLNEDCANG